ncbi:MAG: HAD-IIIC family phosphatase [Oscillospiraceae bacterium]
MLTFNQLKKVVRGIPADKAFDTRVAVLGDTATQFLVTALRGCAYSRGINCDIYEAEYNQIFPEIVNDNSGLYSFAPNYIVIYMSSEKLFDEFCKLPLDQRASFADTVFSRITGQWDKIKSNLSCRIIQFNFAENADMLFGNFGAKTPSSYIFQLRKLNVMLMEAAAEDKSVYIGDLSAIQNTYGRQNTYADKYYYSAKLAISMEMLPYVANSVVDIISALSGKFKKCVVLDLDNTLWGGVIGDDGINNIQIGELGTGRAFSDFQKWLKELKNRGIILAVCSKNNEDTAKEPFEKHPEMVLRPDDIAMFVANWEDKASNIRFIQQTLNIGMDSIVFIDDNPFERNLVRELVPGITVPELPEDPSQYVSFLKKENLFETASFSGEDANRTAQYRAEARRAQLQQSFSSIDDYLESLDMVGTAKPFDAFHTPRISQLTQRSNQFNLRTIRYTEAEIAEIADSDKYLTLYFTLRDKFGDHGLISVVILEKQGDSLFVNEWLMSCRVLKRTVEELIVNTMIKTAAENGFKKVIGEYIPTAKNAMVKDIYEKMGFKRIDDRIFEAEVGTFEYNKCFIKMED